jgi:predicted nucleic acid-binding protein
VSEILVDTSVWLDFFRDRDSPYGIALDRLLQEERVCTTGLITAEIIPGARTLKHYRALKDYFQAIPCVDAPASLWDDVMETQFRLKRKGVNGMSIPDLIIAVVALAADRAVFTKDHDFTLIRKVLPLRIVEVTASTGG